MTSWRDLADPLRPDQTTTLQRFEDAGYADPLTLSEMAREFVADNLTTMVEFNGLEAPSDAEQIHPWQRDTDGSWSREFAGALKHVGGIDVWGEGRQDSAGTVTREVVVVSPTSAAGGRLTLRQAQELAEVIRAMVGDGDRSHQLCHSMTSVAEQSPIAVTNACR